MQNSRTDLLASPSPQSFDLKESSQGENSLVARYVTKGKDDKGPFDVSHTLFLEFEPLSDKVSRAVEYLDSGASSLFLLLPSPSDTRADPASHPPQTR